MAILFIGSTNVFASAAKSKTKQVAPSGTHFIGGNFKLTDHNGKQVSSKTYAGKYLLVFFGFTRCPTVCPIGLSSIMGAMEKLGKQSKEIQPLFISVDSQGDTIKVVKDFVDGYGKPLIGLRGSEEEIHAVVKMYRGYFQKIKDPTSDNEDDYTMDHSSTIYLMDKKGEYLAHFSSDGGSSKLAKAIKAALEN